MPAESPFVQAALEAAASLLAAPLRMERGAPLLYELKVSNALEVINSAQIRNPKRGSSAFQTDLCVFEDRGKDISIPRVVIEFKTGITTHDVLTYSAKAMRHKRIYPYLRYGMLASSEMLVPGRAFTHNEGLDFFAAVKGLDDSSFRAFFSELLDSEIAASRLLEGIFYGSAPTRLFRTQPTTKQIAV